MFFPADSQVVRPLVWARFRRVVCFELLIFLHASLYGQQAPVAPQEHARRANEFLKANKPTEAIPEFKALVAALPDNVDAQANLGVLLYFQARYDEAVDHLRKAVQLNPALPKKIQGLLGLCEYQLGQVNQARSDMQAALAGLTDAKFRKEVGLTLVGLQTAQQDLPAAAATVAKLKEMAPTDPEILFASYRVHTDLAGEALLSLSLTAPRSGQMQQAIAHELERVRDLPGAIASFRKAIALNPDLPGIHFELAEALHGSDSQADRTEAEREYAIALQKNPREFGAAVRLGDIYADRNELDQASTYYQQVLATQPANADASLGLARVYSEKNENEKALPLLLGVLQNDPTNMLAHFRLSALYRKLHRPDDAKRELAEYQKYKSLKEDLRKVYADMRIQAPHGAAEVDSHDAEDSSRVSH